MGLLAGLPARAEAQYFGRNKVQYRQFDFRVLSTDHFDIHYYPEEAEAARLVARMAERWYSRLSRFFVHDLRGRQALILYAAPAHFRQTNAVEGAIGEGTGGVTEALKRRIVLPMAGSLADTDHVLGHELVHAFQFDITGADPREAEFSLPGILQYPLWFAEGMAEYLSLGPVDAQTAMWLRDAVVHDTLPHIKDLNDPRVFPYRWGHAFWAFIGATYGDRAVASLLRSAANPRFDMTGLAVQLGSDPDRLTADWHASIRAAVQPTLDEHGGLSSEPRRLISEAQGSGRLNVGPRLSPDGQWVAYFSEKDRFSVDLFLASATTGRVVRRLISSATDPHFDSLQFLNSAGAWRPDGRVLVLTAVRRGRPALVFVDPHAGRVTREITLRDLDDALAPAWAPDGQSLVVSGNRGGLSDLYRVDVVTGATTPLTRDPWADLEPTFTPDGRTLVFVTERFGTDLESLRPAQLRLATMDVATGEVRPLSAFLSGKHLSPHVTRDGRHVLFVADPDGVSNVYRMPIEGGPVTRITGLPTGVAGIAGTSPALSTASATDRLAFSVFEKGGHTIHLLDASDVVEMVPPAASTRAAALTPEAASGRPQALASLVTGDVSRLLGDPLRGLPPPGPAAVSTPYGRKLSLDLVTQPTVSAGINSFGGFVGGSIAALFSDMLGDRLLGVSAQMTNDFDDFGAQVSYLNRRSRWNWMAVIESMPYATYQVGLRDDTETGTSTYREVVDRQISRGGSFISAFPFSSASRFELSAGAYAVSFNRDTRTILFDTASGNELSRSSFEEKTGKSLGVAKWSAALVRDTTYFGPISPIFGARARLEVSSTTGSLRFTSTTVDLRKYFMPVRPVTLAARVVHVGRYGRDAEHPQLAQFYAGHQELVHGYGFGSFNPAECGLADDQGCRVFGRLLGSRAAVANVELRAPVLGLLRGDLYYGSYVPLEVALFADAGVAWTSQERPALFGGTRDLVRSVGAALRANIFGFLSVELSSARTFDRAGRRWRWQVGVLQGF